MWRDRFSALKSTLAIFDWNGSLSGMRITPCTFWVFALLASGLSQADVISDLTGRAENGEVVAQLELAGIYSKGEGVAKDQAAAAQWVLKAAEQGDVKAQIQLGHRYLKGEGVMKNSENALKWFSKAAESGSAEAQMALGGVYLAGKGVKRNSSEAAKWFTMAAGQGSASAQCQLARMHMTGAGVSKDDLEAYKWASLAAKQGDREAKVVIHYLERKMMPEQLAILQKRSSGSIDSKEMDKAIFLPADIPESLPTELPVVPE